MILLGGTLAAYIIGIANSGAQSAAVKSLSSVRADKQRSAFIVCGGVIGSSSILVKYENQDYG